LFLASAEARAPKWLPLKPPLTAHTRFATRYQSCARDPNGRIPGVQQRSSSFGKITLAQQPAQPPSPAPATFIDHMIALKTSGSDAPENRRWQTREEARAKNRAEWHCPIAHHSGNKTYRRPARLSTGSCDGQTILTCSSDASTTGARPLRILRTPQPIYID